jgi:hypothetical protein
LAAVNLSEREAFEIEARLINLLAAELENIAVPPWPRGPVEHWSDNSPGKSVPIEASEIFYKGSMKPEQLRAWRKWMRWSQRNAAEALGISRGSIHLYELPCENPSALPIPRPVELACYALARGIRSYNGREPSTPVEWPRAGALSVTP